MLKPPLSMRDAGVVVTKATHFKIAGGFLNRSKRFSCHMVPTCHPQTIMAYLIIRLISRVC